MKQSLAALFPALVFIGMTIAILAVFFYVPTEREMGQIQRIFYFHVPSAFSAYGAFFLVFIGSVQFLRTRQDRWDRLAASAAELGVIFTVIVLITGPLWAKPVWGVYWRWEPRLTSLLITFTMYLVYIMVRQYGSQSAQTQRLAAVLGVLAFVNVPIVHYSVRLWSPDQQLHPTRVDLAPEMVYTKYLCYGAFFLLFCYLLLRRLHLEKNTRQIDRLRQHLSD